MSIENGNHERTVRFVKDDEQGLAMFFVQPPLSNAELAEMPLPYVAVRGSELPFQPAVIVDREEEGVAFSRKAFLFGAESAEAYQDRLEDFLAQTAMRREVTVQPARPQPQFRIAPAW